MKESKIQWTDATWNPWHGCKKVSAGCKYCYMFRDKERYGQEPSTVLKSKTMFKAPLKWSEPKLVFTCSWSDWFIEEADEWRDEAWAIIKATPHHTYQILTKRPERILEHLPDDWGDGYDNVWLGVSVESNETIHRIETLASVPAKIRFISAEPLIGEVNLQSLASVLINKIDWLIIGGESGNEIGKYQYRPCEYKWIEQLIEISNLCKVKVFVKQLGTHLAKVNGLKDRHGGNMEEFPEELKRREFPIKNELKHLNMKIDQIEIIANTLAIFPECDESQIDSSMNSLMHVVKEPEKATPNTDILASLPDTLEKIVCDRFRTGANIDLGAKRDKVFINRNMEVLNLTYGLSKSHKLNKIDWLRQIGPLFLGLEVCPSEFEYPFVDVEDKGFMAAQASYLNLSLTLDRRVSAHDLLATANYYSECQIMVVKNEYAPSYMTELDLLLTALYIQFITNPIVTKLITFDDKFLVDSLIVSFQEKDFDVISEFRKRRDSGTKIFEALWLTFEALNKMILSRMIELSMS